MPQQRLTDRSLAPYITGDTLIHIVNTGDTSQYFGGSSYKATIDQVANYINQGITDTYVTGGTYSAGTATFTNNNGGTFDVTGFTQPFTGNTSGDCITDLYISNLYGCSPIKVWDNLTLSGSVIDSQGGGYIDLRYGNSDGRFYLGNDNGGYSDTFIQGENGYLEISAYDPAARITMFTDGGNAGFVLTNDTSFFSTDINLYTDTTSIVSTPVAGDGNNMLEINNDNIFLKGNSKLNITVGNHSSVGPGIASDLLVAVVTGASYTTDQLRETNPSILSSQYSTIQTGIKNSVILGGYNLNATQDNTAYVDNLNINTIGSGTSVINLGLDSSGNVVTGVTTTDTNTYVTGFTYNDANTLTISRNGGLGDLTTSINTMTGLTISGDLDVNGSLNIGTVLSGTPTFNLGIDSSGNVVSGITSNLLYSQTNNYTLGVPITINHNLNTTDVLVQIVDTNTNELIYGTIDNYQTNSLDVTLSTTINNIKVLVIGSSVSQIVPKGSIVYTLGHNSISPTDNNDYFIGQNFNLTPSTSSNDGRRFIVQKTGTVTQVSIKRTITGTLGSSETNNFYVNNVTQATQGFISSGETFDSSSSLTNYTLSTPLNVTAGDKLEIEWLTPAWVTNPTSVRQTFNMVIEY